MAEANPYASPAGAHAAAAQPMMPASDKLRRKLLRAFSAHSLGNLVTLADRFMLLPVMLYYWGPAITGIWMTIRAIPAVLSVGELGFASATGNRMTEHVARQELTSAARVYWGTNRLIGSISAGCILVAVAMLLWTPLAHWFRCDALNTWEFNTSVLCMTVYTVSVFQTQLYFAGFRSIDMQALGAFGIHSIRIFELILVVAALVFWPKVWLVAAAYVTARLSGAMVLRAYLLRRAAWLNQDRSTTWSEVRPLIKPALGFGALPIAQTCQLQGTTMAIAIATSPEQVAAFIAMRTLARFPIQFSSTLGRTAWPELSHALAKGHQAIALKLHHRMMLVSLLLNFISVALLIALGKLVFDLWTVGRLEFSWWTFVLLSLAAGVNAYTTNAMTVLNAMSMHGRASAVWVSIALLSTALAALAPEWWGIQGVCWILLIAELVALVYVWEATRVQLAELNHAATERAAHS